jgi:peptide/nickel transport system substrate-binding protein
MAPLAHADTPGGTIVMAKSIDDLVSLDPAETYEVSGIELDANAYDRLVEIDLNHGNAIVSGLAESWSGSPDGLTYTFKLRPGVRFQSGNPVIAADVVYSITRTILLNKTPAFILAQFGFTKDNLPQTVRAIDDSTVALTMAKPFAPTFLLNCLTSTAGDIVDSKLVQAHEKDGDFGNGWLRQNTAGSGAYKLRSYTPNEQFTLDAYDGWYRGKPKNRRVVVRHVSEPATQRLLLSKGDIDIARNLSADQLAALKDDPGIRIVRADTGLLMYLALNQKNPILAKPAVQEALRWLVDYAGIEHNLLDGTFKVHQTFLPDGFLGVVDDTPYHLDVAKAKALLEQAGYPDGFSITMDVRSNRPWTDVAQSIQASWAQAGIKLQLLQSDYRQGLTRYRSRAHDIYLAVWSPDYLDPNTNAEAFATNSNNADDTTGTKTIAWRNYWAIPELSQRTGAALMERDDAQRAADYAALQRDVLHASPYVIMFEAVEAVAERAAVSGWTIGPSAAANFYAPITKD